MYCESRRDHSHVIEAMYRPAEGWSTDIRPPHASVIVREQVRRLWNIVRHWETTTEVVAIAVPFEELQALTKALPGFDLALRAEYSVRTFTNSEGISFRRVAKWFDLNGRRGELETIACGGETFDQLLHYLGQTSFTDYGDGAIRVKSNEDLLLEPQVAAVLIHELCGHGFEQGMIFGHLGNQLTVRARFPLLARFDDEGVHTRTQVLVEDGWVCAGQIKSRRVHPVGSGFAQAALHDPETEVRLTHLEVEAAKQDIVPDRNTIRCRRCEGAELIGPAIVIRINGAERFRKDLVPFVAVLNLAGFSRKLACVGATRVTQGGRCVKGGASLPTLVTSPAVLLRNVTCISL